MTLTMGLRPRLRPSKKNGLGTNKGKEKA